MARAEIYTQPVLDAILELGYAPESLLATAAIDPRSIEVYPDGSVQVETTNQEIEPTPIVKALADHELRVKGELRDPAAYLNWTSRLGGWTYSSLACFPEKLYSIYYYGDFVKKIPTGHIPIRTADTARRGNDAVFAEAPPDRLLVSIGFERCPAREKRDALVHAITSWYSSVKTRGVFNEGCVRLASRDIEFCDRLAHFRIDVTGTGQNTVNWLIISLLAFCPMQLIARVYFTTHAAIEGKTSRPLTFSEYYGLEGKRTSRARICLAE